jgi:hypothetical protein
MKSEWLPESLNQTLGHISYFILDPLMTKTVSSTDTKPRGVLNEQVLHDRIFRIRSSFPVLCDTAIPDSFKYSRK